MADKLSGSTPIINHINITQNRRGIQDIASWRTAISSAENIATPRRILLYDLYQEILLDGHLSAVIEKRKLSLSNTPITFTTNGEVNEEITQLTTTENFINLLHFIIDAKFFGHSLVEINFNNNSLQPALIPRKHVVPEKGIIIRNQFDISGFNFREQPYTNFTIEVGEPNSLGLLLKCCQYALYKRGGFGDWAQLSQLFGMPFRIAKYDGYDSNTRSQLETALKEAGSAAYIVIPKEASFEFIQNYSTASNQLYEQLINVCNKEISKLILGQTLTTEAGGALAQAKVHQETEREIIQADKIFVTNILNDKLIPLLKIHGYNVGNGKFFFKEQQHIDLNVRLDMDLKLSEKIKIPDEYFYKTYNIPKS